MKKALMLSFIVMLTMVTVSISYNLLPDANAQLVNVDVDGVRRVIGDEPKFLGGGEYRVRQKWFPRSLAVYLDGKRCQRGVDYVVVHRERTITFQIDTNNDSVVIVDYEPR